MIELQDRYQMEPSEILSVYNDHMSEMPQVRVSQQHVFPPSVIEVLDRILDIHLDDAEEKSLISISDEEKELFNRQINSLKEALQEAQETNKSLKKEKDDIQDQFIAIQNGREGLNAQLLKRLQLENDTLTHQLENLKKLKDDQLQLKDKRINDLENQISSLHQTREENANILQEKMRAEIKIMNMQKAESSMNAVISQKDNEIQLLESKNSALSEDKVSMENELIACRGEMKIAVEELLKLAASLKLSINQEKDTITTLPQINPVNHDAPFIADSPEKQAVPEADEMPPSYPF